MLPLTDVGTVLTTQVRLYNYIVSADTGENGRILIPILILASAFVSMEAIHNRITVLLGVALSEAYNVCELTKPFCQVRESPVD